MFAKRFFHVCAGLLCLALHPTHSQAEPANHDNTPPNWLADTISTDRTITFATPGPNYIVYGDVTVLPGVTLTIEPGVTLTFAGDGDFMVSGTHPGRSELLVHGTVSALAPAGAPVRFESNGAQQWGGLTVFPGATALLRNSVFDFATAALRVYSPCDIDSSAFTGCTIGIHVQSAFTATQTSIAASGVAIDVRSQGNGVLAHCNINGPILANMIHGTMSFDNCSGSGDIVATGVATLTATNSTFGPSTSITSPSGPFTLSLNNVQLHALGDAITAPEAYRVDLNNVSVTTVSGNGVEG